MCVSSVSVCVCVSCGACVRACMRVCVCVCIYVCVCVLPIDLEPKIYHLLWGIPIVFFAQKQNQTRSGSITCSEFVTIMLCAQLSNWQTVIGKL